MAYSEDFRRRTIEYYHEGNTQDDVSAVFKISRSTLRDWEHRYKTGNLKPSYPKTRSGGKLQPDELANYVEEFPDAFLSEIGVHFGCSAEAVRKALVKLKITLKKRHCATRNVAKPNESNTKNE